MSGTLYVVATPIGNLEDLTFRALRVLREVNLIAAEDTRRTAKLLQHYSISTRATSFHAHNERKKQTALLQRLRDGQHLALVSDAGTPTISDPGSRLVAAAIEDGIRVEAIPGPSAVLAALVASGYSTGNFTFVGFPPNRSNNRKRWLKSVADEPRPVVFFEAPHRIRATLKEAREILGDREIAIARELTKIHKQLVKGPISYVLSFLNNPKGEITVVLRPNQKKTVLENLPSTEQLWHEFCYLTKNEGASRRHAISTLAKRYGQPAKTVYAVIERAKSAVV